MGEEIAQLLGGALNLADALGKCLVEQFETLAGGHARLGHGDGVSQWIGPEVVWRQFVDSRIKALASFGEVGVARRKHARIVSAVLPRSHQMRSRPSQTQGVPPSRVLYLRDRHGRGSHGGGAAADGAATGRYDGRRAAADRESQDGSGHDAARDFHQEDLDNQREALL